jgi:hypothetical protein
MYHDACSRRKKRKKVAARVSSLFWASLPPLRITERYFSIFPIRRQNSLGLVPGQGDIQHSWLIPSTTMLIAPLPISFHLHAMDSFPDGANRRPLRTTVSKTKKADEIATLKGFDLVGLLLDKPPGTAELLFI